jgi:hypothetical protein
MATETVGSLLVSLGFNSAEFDRGIGKANQQVRQLSTNFNAASKDVAVAANRMGMSIRQFSGNVTALKAQLDPAGTALANYRNQMNLLRESYKLGAISQAQFVTGTQGALATYRANGAQINRTNGQMQSGMQQLGFQMNDVATQFASGTRPMQIFAQQSGQVIQAVQMMVGGTGRFATFMMGPWGIALTAGVIALTPFIGKLMETVFAANKATGALDELIKKRREERAESEKLFNADKDLNGLLTQRARLEAYIAKQPRNRATGAPMFVYKQQQELAAVNKQIAEGRDALDSERTDRMGLGLDKATNGLAKPSVPKAGGGASSKPSGPSASDISRAFNEERRGLMQQYNSAMGSMALSAGEAAEFELRNVELARIRTLDQIKHNKDYSAAQKTQLVSAVDELAEVERQRVEREKTKRLDQEAEQARQAQAQNEIEKLRLQMSLTDTEGQRLALALRIFDLEQQEERNALERIIASDTRTVAEKALAQQAMDALDANRSVGAAVVSRQNETRAQAFARGLSKSTEQINEAIAGIKIDALETLSDGIVDAIVNFKSLGDVASSILKQVLADLLRLQIQQAIIKPLAGMLGLSIPGFATGTNFAPGGMAIVGERGPELVNLPRGSQVIPNHELSGMGSQQIHKPTFVFPGVTDAKQARESAAQAAMRYRRELNAGRAA